MRTTITASTSPSTAALRQCTGCLSRRQCLKMITTAAASLSLGPGLYTAAARSRKADPNFVDPAGLRPHPQMNLEAAILEQPRPYWLGWPGTTYDLDLRQKEYRALLAASCQKLGVTLREEAKPVSKENDLVALIKGVQERKPHGLLVILQHMQSWGWANRLANEAGVPLIVFSPIGTSFTGHVNDISRRAGVHVVSSLEWPAVEDGIRMIRAKRMFEETRLLWIRGTERNETVLDRLGVKVRSIPRASFNELFAKMPESEEVKDIASTFRKHAKKIVEPTWQDQLNCARAYTTAKRLMADEKANGLSMDCLGMVSDKLVPTPPCGAWTMLQDQGITAGCEADLHGATSMLLTSYLLDRPGYMNDPVAETAKNLLIVAHCTSGTRLDGFDQKPAPYILRDHSESSLGVSVQVLFPVNKPVSLIRFQNTNELIFDSGKVVSNVNTPPAGGCRTSVEVAMDDVEDCRDVLGFHQVVTLGNHCRMVEGFCQLYGINVVHSPRYGTHKKA
ncbi:MAG TPA: hypothetical protein VJA21_08105 [Verrucomicrobiae bacterium]